MRIFERIYAQILAQKMRMLLRELVGHFSCAFLDAFLCGIGAHFLAHKMRANRRLLGPADRCA